MSSRYKYTLFYYILLYVTMMSNSSLNQGCQTHIRSRRRQREKKSIPQQRGRNHCNPAGMITDNTLTTQTDCSLCFYFGCVLGTLCILLPPLLERHFGTMWAASRRPNWVEHQCSSGAASLGPTCVEETLLRHPIKKKKKSSCFFFFLTWQNHLKPPYMCSTTMVQQRAQL